MSEADHRARLSQGEFLRQRNALWRQLRAFEPGDARAEPVMLELMRLTNLSREKILEGLGWA